MALTQVKAAGITADSIDETKIADNGIDSEHYNDGSIDHAHLANDAVDGDNIADNSINSEHYVDGSIDTAHIADDQITLAKMASGTDGVIITYDASGNPVHVGPGNDGQVLTSTGAGSPPAFEDVSAGVTSDAQGNTIAGGNAGEDFDGTNPEYNTLFGKNAGKDITTANSSTAVGYDALAVCTTGAGNTAIGRNTLKACTGAGNVAIGREASESLTSASDNTSVGFNANKDGVTTGTMNVFVGAYAGRDMTSGFKNVCIGAETALVTTTGHYLSACGHRALHQVTEGNSNSAIGDHSGFDLTSGDNNTMLGSSSGRSSSPSGSVTTGNNIVCIGNNSVSDIYCADTSISSSDQRDKTDFTDWTHGLDWINKLKPVTYRWDKRSWYSDDLSVTPNGSKKRARLHLGFKAQDVLEVEKADGYASKKDDMLLINLNEDGTAYGMKYERLVVVLTKAVQELSAKNDALEARIAALESA